MDVVESVELQLQDAAVEEEQACQGDVLRRGGYLSIDSEVRQVGANFVLAHFLWVSLVMEEDELFDVVAVGFFSSDAEVAQACDC